MLSPDPLTAPPIARNTPTKVSSVILPFGPSAPIK